VEFGRPHGDIDTQLHIHDRGTGEVHDIYRQFRTMLDGYSPSAERVATAEIAVVDPQTWASYYGGQLDELHLPFNFRLIGAAWNADALRDIIDTIERVVPTGAWPTWVLVNHDEPRMASRLGTARAGLAMMLLLTLRGTPTIYYGDELAMQDAPVAPEQVRDPWEQRMPGRGLGRDPERSPMRWTSEPPRRILPVRRSTMATVGSHDPGKRSTQRPGLHALPHPATTPSPAQSARTRAGLLPTDPYRPEVSGISTDARCLT
jgi:alpha-glucosidase